MMHLVEVPKKRVSHSLGLYTFGAILIILKLTKAIDVSWALVLLPFYIAPLIILSAIVLMLVVAILSGGKIKPTVTKKDKEQ